MSRENTNIRFCSFASGSSGNCYMVRDDETAILIDAGISGKKIFEALEQTQTPKEMVSAVLVTHEHIDHVKSLPILSKKIPDLDIFANRATWESIERPVADDHKSLFVTNEPFQIGAFTIIPFAISHDAAEPVGFSLYNQGKKVSIITDSGYISEEIFQEIHDADLLLLEANHEKELLLFSRYPYSVKQRILGDEGHLSNIHAGECLCRIVNECPKPRRVLLGHLSHENNTPEVAMQAVVNTLEEENIFVGGDLKLHIAHRDTMSRIFEV